MLHGSGWGLGGSGARGATGCHGERARYSRRSAEKWFSAVLRGLGKEGNRCHGRRRVMERWLRVKAAAQRKAAGLRASSGIRGSETIGSKFKKLKNQRAHSNSNDIKVSGYIVWKASFRR